MELHNIKKIKGNRKPKKIVGRGRGSGKGAHTVGKGQKGQKSRAGKNIPAGFEGGQVPLFRKLPILSRFKSPKRYKTITITLDRLNIFEDGLEITPQTLIEKGMIKKTKRTKVKVVGTGELKKILNLSGFEFSENARKQAEKAGAVLS
ncbi:MAG: 50S ribosomal protein L15 [candidate division WWE3 bacterium GW2011_GWA1_41_8]|nr:MAG: 50S ribosomal protein L15 [candidate division WWE3 bacterium GW2011_GWA1_41_8]OGC56647.1 MAG: 50S ribosomal protein L15 [candidate division WWE3 bacterium RIFCSPLOWO2_01_FULL_41_9]